MNSALDFVLAALNKYPRLHLFPVESATKASRCLRTI